MRAIDSMLRDTLQGSGQVGAVVAALPEIMADALIGLYLHGSAAVGALRPQSDIDLLAVIDADMSASQRERLLAALLRISGRHPTQPGHPRCIELLVFQRADLASAAYPPRATFLYGEWLRQRFEAGAKPALSSDPEYTFVLAKARTEAIALLGPPATAFLPEVPTAHVRKAMGDVLPTLIQSLPGDERNVLLTLARLWHTASEGDFPSKEAAAEWAFQLLDEPHRATLDHARKAYVGELADDWASRQADAMALAQELRLRVVALL